MGGKDGAGAADDIAARGAAQAGGHGVAFAHRTQIAAQMGQIAIADALRQQVRHRQCQPRPLQQPAHVANLSHRQDAGRQAAGDLGLGLGQCGAQFGQGLVAEADADEQPVLAQGAAALGDLADRILGPVQRHGVDHQVMRARYKIDHRIIGHDARLRQARPPDFGKAGHDGGGRKGSVNLDQPIVDLIGGNLVEQVDKPRTPRAVALAQQGIRVGQGGARAILGDLHGIGT